MPAIRNRPRVDVVVRVPKARPWSESDDVWPSTAAEAAGAVGTIGKGKEREGEGEGEGGGAGVGVGGSSTALGGGGVPTTIAADSSRSSLSTAAATTTTIAPLGSGAAAGPSATSSSSASVLPPPPPKTRPAETSCAEWNSLLIWARRMRGPQWDSSVGMWMVDQGSEEYYR